MVVHLDGLVARDKSARTGGTRDHVAEQQAREDCIAVHPDVVRRPVCNVRGRDHHRALLGLDQLLGRSPEVDWPVCGRSWSDHADLRSDQLSEGFGKSGSKESATHAVVLRYGKADTREAVRLGVLASVLNVTNIPSWVAFGLFIERGGLTQFETFEIWIATTIASVSAFVVITVIFLMAKEFLRKWFTRAKEFIIKHSSSLVPGLLACVAVLLIYIGLSDLLS